MNERLTGDEDAIGNYYYNKGYVFYNLDPVEVNIDGDSIDLGNAYSGRSSGLYQ